MSNKISDRYAGVSISSLTADSLQDPLGNVYASAGNKLSMERLVKLIDLKKAYSTFGPCLPGSGAVSSSESTPHNLQASAGGVYKINAISATAGGAPASIAVYLTDGTLDVLLTAATVSAGQTANLAIPSNMFTTNSMYLHITHSATATSRIAYTQVVQ